MAQTIALVSGAVVVFLVVVIYLLGPVLIRFTFKQPDRPKVKRYGDDAPRLPRGVAAYFREVREALEPLGFEEADLFALPNQPNVQCTAMMLAHRRDKTAALATVMHAQATVGDDIKTKYVEFVTRFRDGTVVQTNNSHVLSSFPLRPGTTSTQFPMVPEEDELYILHQGLVQRHGSDSPRVLRLDEEFDGDARAFLKQAIVEEFEAQLGTGYIAHDAAAGVYRPTWKGAFLMTWGELWPFKAVRLARRARKARQLLAELAPK